MGTMKRVHMFFFAIACILCGEIMTAQISTRDVIYLKNGSIIKGSILEIIPDKSVKLETTDGRVYVYLMSEIDKITKETYQSSIEEMSGSSFSIYGGVGITAGNFAKEGGTAFPAWVNTIRSMGFMQNPGFPGSGCARAGFTGGIQFSTGGTIGWIINAAYARNNVSHNPPWQYPTSTGTTVAVNIETDSWTSMNVSTGVKFGTANPHGFNFFVAPLIGAVYMKSPNIRVVLTESGTTETIQLESVASKAFTTGAEIECMIEGLVVVGGRYMYSTPLYDVPYAITYGTASQSGTVSHTQSTSIILAYIGFSF